MCFRAVCCKVDGCVFAIYNVGMMDHAVGVQQQRVSDGLYHVVRFTRDGPNSTLHVDDLPVQHKRPTGILTHWAGCTGWPIRATPFI